MNIILHRDSTECHRQDAGKMENLCDEVKDVGTHNHEEGLNGADVVGKSASHLHVMQQG